MPRIAYITGEYPRATDTFIQREVSALRGKGLHIETISVRRPAERENVGTEQRTECEQTFYILPCSPFTLVLAHLSLLCCSPFAYVSAMCLAWGTRSAGIRSAAYQLFYFLEAGVVARHMKREQLAHLHCHSADASGTVALLASHMGRFSYSLTLHGPGIFVDPVRWRLDLKIHYALFVVCISHFCRSQAMLWSNPGDWCKLHIVHCGVDPSRYSASAHAGRGMRLLYVGRIASVKGLPVLLDAISRLVLSRADVQLTVVGDGLERPAIEACARDLGLKDHVQFVGYKSQNEVAEHMRKTDLVVMSSFAEGVPVSLMEAMASGLPVVAPMIAGIPELVTHGESGLLVWPGDPESLETAIKCLLDDGELRARMGRAGRARVISDYDIHIEAGKLAAVFEEELSTAPAAERSSLS